MRRLFADREFLAYFVALQSGRLGYGIESVAILWQIYSLRQNPFDIGLVGLVLFLPLLLLAIPAGIIADIYDRRMVCIASSLLEGGGQLLFIALIVSGTRSLPLSFAAVAAIGIAHSLGTPAERALLAEIVTSERFVRASALTTSIGQVISIAGPALAGILIALRVWPAFAVAAGCYALAAIAYSFLTPRSTWARALHLRTALDGIAYIFSQPVLLGAISLDLFAVLFGGATALLPIFAVNILHVGPIGFGLLNAAPAVGATLVALYLARRPIVRNAGPLLLWCVSGFGVATIVFGLSRNLPLSLLALAATGGFDVVSVVIRNALVQLGTPDALRGRVSAIENIFIGASNQLGAFESGTLAGFVGAVPSVIIGGCATLVVIALWAWRFPQLRSYDRIAVAKPPVEEPL